MTAPSRRWLAILGFLTACTVPTGPTPAERLQAARTRPAPLALVARGHLTLTAPPGLLGAPRDPTDGRLAHGPAALRLARPGRLHLETTGPLGGTTFRAVLDGTDLGLWLGAPPRHVHGPAVAPTLRALSGGLLDPDLLVGLLVGDLPLDAAPATVTDQDGPLAATWPGPGGTRLDATLDAADRPATLVVRSAQGSRVLDIRWSGWRDGLPAGVQLQSPATGLALTLDDLSWSRPAVVAPFDPRPAPGTPSLPLSTVVARLTTAALLGGRPASGPRDP